MLFSIYIVRNKWYFCQQRKKIETDQEDQTHLLRLLESNGPDIKIKGSASQIVEKYLALSRESQSSGDPIAAESYLQYAEHYQRIVDANELKIQRSQKSLYR